MRNKNYTRRVIMVEKKEKERNLYNVIFEEKPIGFFRITKC